MLTVPTTSSYEALRGDLQSVADRFVTLLRATSGAHARAIGQWAAGDVAAHVCSVVAVNNAFATGIAPTSLQPTLDFARTVTARTHPQLTAMANDWTGTRDMRELADRVEAGIAEMLSHTVRTSGAEPRPWLAGIQIPLRAVLGHMTSELLVHGGDVARATRQPWIVPDGEARHFFEDFAVEMIPAALEAGFFDSERAPVGDVDWEIRLRGASASGFSYRDDRLQMVPADRGGFDVHISATPSAMLLVVHGRVHPLVPVLKGQIAVWGRRPWRLRRTMAALPSL